MRDSSALVERLASVVPSDRIVSDGAGLFPYAFDASFWSLRHQRVPDVVVIPRSTEEVQAIVRVANETATPLVARGAGTGQTAGAVAVRGGIVMAFPHMREILSIDRQDLQCLVQPGVVHVDLQSALRPRQLFFPPDPGSGRACTLGGMAANNASGPHAVKYGVMSTYVLGLEVVLADATCITTGGERSRVLKSSSGIDVTKLFVGSEGTLGIITKLRLRVQPLPPARAVVLAAFAQLEDVVRCLDDLFGAGILPATAELLDRSALDAIRLYRPELGIPDGEAILLLEVDGLPEGVKEQSEAVASLAKRRATATQLASDEAHIQRLWQARASLGGAVALIHPDKRRIFAGEDLCVPLSGVPQTIRRARELAREAEIPVLFYGHVGDGNVHSAILIDPSNEDEVRRADRLAHRLHELALELGGSTTGEHGTGMVRAPYMRAEHGASLDTMLAVKRALDPKGILNPGKIFPEG
jgi:glycolate oxidase